MRRPLGVLVLALTCCGGGEAEPSRAIVLSPEPALAELTQEWASRWSVATGIPVLVGEGGIPVMGVDSIPDEDGKPPCGRTQNLFSGGEFLRTDNIRVDTTPSERCAAWGYALGHEIAHAIAPGITHPDEGLLRAPQRRGVELGIDAEALAAVCSAVECPAFQPEP